MGILMLAEIVHQRTGTTGARVSPQGSVRPARHEGHVAGLAPAKKEPSRGARQRRPAQDGLELEHTVLASVRGAVGGLITSPADFARFCQMMLNGASSTTCAC